MVSSRDGFMWGWKAFWEGGREGEGGGRKGEGGGRKGGGRRERKGEKIGREERRERKNYMKIGQN